MLSLSFSFRCKFGKESGFQHTDLVVWQKSMYFALRSTTLESLPRKRTYGLATNERAAVSSLQHAEGRHDNIGEEFLVPSVAKASLADSTQRISRQKLPVFLRERDRWTKIYENRKMLSALPASLNLPTRK